MVRYASDTGASRSLDRAGARIGWLEALYHEPTRSADSILAAAIQRRSVDGRSADHGSMLVAAVLASLIADQNQLALFPAGVDV